MFNNLSTKTIAVVAAAMAVASADAATVRSGKSVRDILSAAQFDDMFSGRRGVPNCADGEKYLTYDNFVNAADTYYPEAFTSSTDEYNRRELAAFLGQISQETTGWWGDQPYNWGLCYVEEVAYKGSSGVHYATEHAVYPPAPGKSYHGRGAMQVSWNYNYGALSESLYGDKDVLLSKPELLASDGELMFRASLWFWMTPQSPKPSAHDVMQDNVKSETCRPNGFGTTTNIINGGLECSTAGEAHHAVGQKVYNRIAYYKRYCEILGVSPGEYTECAGQKNYVEAPTCPSDYVTPQDGETNENNNNGISQPFRCGINWNDANTKCGTICAVNGDCPTGEGCYSNMMNPECAIEDGDIVPPTSGPETSTAAPTTTTSSAAAPTTTSSTAAPTTTSSAAAPTTTTSAVAKPCSTETVFVTSTSMTTVVSTITSTATSTVSGEAAPTSTSPAASTTTTSAAASTTTTAAASACEATANNAGVTTASCQQCLTGYQFWPCNTDHCNSGCFN